MSQSMRVDVFWIDLNRTDPGIDDSLSDQYWVFVGIQSPVKVVRNKKIEKLFIA